MKLTNSQYYSAASLIRTIPLKMTPASSYKLLAISILVTLMVNTLAKVQLSHDSIETEQNLNEAHGHKIDRIKLPHDQKLIVRLPSNTLLKFTAYKDVSILHFHVPPDTRVASFMFKAFEESKSAFQRKCKAQDVTLHLKASSYPVISPENITFPKNFLNFKQRLKTYSLQFKSDDKQHFITVEGPRIGNWFAAAFVSWTDPNNERIEQQGLTPACDTLLLAELSVSQLNPTIVNDGQWHKGLLKAAMPTKPTLKQYPKEAATLEPKVRTLIKRSAPIRPHENGNNQLNTMPESMEAVYKFYAPQNVDLATAYISVTRVCLVCKYVMFYVQANAMPRLLHESKEIEFDSNTENSFIYNSLIRANQTGRVTMKIHVQPNAWHYVVLKMMHITTGMDELHDKYYTAESVENTTMKLNNLDFGFRIDFIKHTNHSSSNVLNRSVNAQNDSHSTSVKQAPSPWQPVKFRNMEFYPLLRQSYREFFMFDFDLVPDENGTVPTVLNLTAGRPAGFGFEVGDVYDIGGTLSFAVSMKSEQKDGSDHISSITKSELIDRSVTLAGKLIGTTTDTIQEKSLPRSNQTIIVCMNLGEPGQPTWPDKCQYGSRTLPASSIVNNTDVNTSTGLIHIPFPESGQWYVTMGLYCHGAETTPRAIIDSVKEFVKSYIHLVDSMQAPCACANESLYYRTCVHDEECLLAMNETETLKIKECMMDSKCTKDYLDMTQKFETHHKLATEQHFGVDNCNASVVFTISSSPCVAGRCGRYGRCYHYMSGGFVFSTCICNKGYRGWDCSEDTQVPSRMSVLLASLLLTLSNLLFIPSIYLAFHRKYYSEAVIYFFSMFFSIFYHACDSGEDDFSFCLVKISVLQFCDFYCGLLAIWVTLVAMSNIKLQIVAVLHIVGAIVLAFGTELNKQSLWVFLAPSLTGICILSTSWLLRCYKSKNLFPSRRYLTIYLPIGMFLVIVGLVCYAFLQTKQNYHIVHSIWHMVMAMSIICLLPSRKSFIPKC